MRIASLVALVTLAIAPPAPASAQRPERPRPTAEPADPLRLTHRARAVRPGEVIALTADPSRPVERILVSGLGAEIPMWREPAGRRWRVLLGIDVDHQPGPITLTFTATDSRGTSTATAYPLVIEPARFAERHLTVPPRFVEPPESERPRIERERERLQAIYQAATTDRRPGAFAPPVPHRRSSPFGARSVFNGVPRDRHAGLDFASPAGATIRAPAAGRVVLVDALYYTGNTVVVDHGYGVVSVFAHLQRTMVDEGAVVSRGARLGTVGATGRATGPHLHWSVRLGGARVDPAAVLHVQTEAPARPRHRPD
jgi:murein DD-endopeptidase MepM/ murein hydrolase activator NlpD